LFWLFFLGFFWQIFCKEKINCSRRAKFVSERALEAVYLDLTRKVDEDLWAGPVFDFSKRSVRT
jgi:hypothetical protein